MGVTECRNGGGGVQKIDEKKKIVWHSFRNRNWACQDDLRGVRSQPQNIWLEHDVSSP